MSWPRSVVETEELTQTKKPVGGWGRGNGAPNRSTSASKILSGLHCGPRAAQQARERRCPDEQDMGSTAKTLSVSKVHGLGTFTLFTGGLSFAECLERTGPTPQGYWRSQRLHRGPFTGSVTPLWRPFPLATFLETHPCVTSPRGLLLCSQAQLGTSVFLVPISVSGIICLPPLPVVN